jgi:hypothetical protein
MGYAEYSSGLPIMMKKESNTATPIMTSDTHTDGNVFSSKAIGVGAQHEDFRAFDGNIVDGWVTDILTNQFIGFQFNQPRTIIEYGIIIGTNQSTDRSPKTWRFEASNDGTTWKTLHSGNSVVGEWTVGVERKFTINNNSSFTRYRLFIVDINGGNYMTMGELKMYQVISDPRYSLTTRLLTGGTAAADKDNEWDNYIVNSTLNGTITAGDNNVWNYDVAVSTLTSTTGATGATARAYRGNVVPRLTYWGSSVTSTTSGMGFRPVLLIETLPQPPVFTGSLDKTQVHSEDVTLSGTITDPMNGNVQYKISVNGSQVYPASDLTAPEQSPVQVSYTVTNTLLNLGSNSIELYVVNGSAPSTYTYTVNLNSAVPTITASMTGMKLDTTITDSENDLIQFNVKLNGAKVYPTDPAQEYTSFVTGTATYSRLFASNEVQVGQTNTVVVEAKDKYGAISTATLTFVGEYTGLMFSDIDGNYYTTDLGELLQYLDFGTMIAGTTSVAQKVRLTNKYPFSVADIYLTMNNMIGPSVVVAMDTDEGFSAPSQTLLFSGTFAYDSFMDFYVRIETVKEAEAGGMFDIYAKADPV